MEETPHQLQQHIEQLENRVTALTEALAMLMYRIATNRVTDDELFKLIEGVGFNLAILARRTGHATTGGLGTGTGKKGIIKK